MIYPQAVWVFFLIDYEPPTYNNGQYQYPWWAEALGWGIASLSLAAIPVMAVLAVYKAQGDTLKEVRDAAVALKCFPLSYLFFHLPKYSEIFYLLFGGCRSC